MGWASSIRAVSGQYALYPNHSPIFPSDFIFFRCRTLDCECKTFNAHRGRVVAIGRDRTSTAIRYDAVTLIVQRVENVITAARMFPDSAQQFEQPLNHYDLVIIEDKLDYLLESDIDAHIDLILIDRHFKNGITAMETSFPSTKERQRVKWIASAEHMKLRAVVHSHAIRGELELKAFGRTHFLKYFGVKTLSVPMVCFVDGFGLFRNMKRSLDGCYITFANLPLRQRNRRVNVFTLMLIQNSMELPRWLRLCLLMRSYSQRRG